MNHQDLQQKINTFSTAAATSNVSVEENLSRHILLSQQKSYMVLKVDSSKSLTPMSERFNIGNEIISDEPTTFITIIADEQITEDITSLFLSFENSDKWYKIVEENAQLDMEIMNSADIQDNEKHVYKLMDVSLEDRKHNFSQVFHILDDENGTKRYIGAKISKVTTPQMLLNKIYGIDDANNKTPVSIPHLMPTVITPLSTHHDSKYLHLARDLSKAIDLKYVDDMMESKIVDECLVFGKRASDLPDAEKPTDTDYQLALSLRTLYINCIIMTHAAATGFKEYTDTQSVAGIKVNKITKLSPDVCVKMVIDNYLHANPSISDSESWRRFLTMLFASSRFIAGGSYTTESGQDSTATTLLPFYISPTTRISKDILATNFKIEIKSKLFDITDRVAKTYESDKKVLENLYKERTIWAGSWFQYDVLKNNLAVDTSITNVEKRIFSEDSSVAKNLVFGQFDDVNKYKQYCGQDSSKPATKQTVTKVFTYSWDNKKTSISRQDVDVPIGQYTGFTAQPNTLLSKTKYPKTNAAILKFAQSKFLPSIWTMKSYNVYLQSAFDVDRFGHLSMTFRIEIIGERDISVTEINENYNNPVLDHEDTQQILNLVNNSTNMEITPVGLEKLQYLFIRAIYFDTYEIEVELEYEDLTDTNNPVMKTETKSLGVHNFKSKNDNSVTIQKLAISQTRVI